jgi:hypothetical protein
MPFNTSMDTRREFRVFVAPLAGANEDVASLAITGMTFSKNVFKNKHH